MSTSRGADFTDQPLDTEVDQINEGFRPISARDLRSRVRWTWQLVLVLAPREVRTRYRQSVLDLGWALINPITVLVIYGIVLTQSFNVSGNGVPYLTFAWTGLVLWTFFANALGGGVVSLVSSSDLITKLSFPKEALPLGIVGASLADLAIGLLCLLVLMPVQGVSYQPAMIASVLPILVLIVWAAALSVLTAVVAAFVRDVPQVVSLGLRVGFFASPVMYPASELPAAFRWSATVSPVAVGIEGARTSLLRGELPDLPLILIQLAIGIVVLVLAILYTRSIEARIADVV